jgi:RNA polymerase-binding transcription factor DksA
LNKHELKSLREELELIVGRVRSDASALAEQAHAASGGNGDGELSNAPLHLADMGTAEQLYDVNTALLANEQYLVNESRDALRRIEDGKFGVCESCGRPIAKERLRAMPFARYCLQCAEEYDTTPQVNVNDGRPQVPADTLAPEGEMQERVPRPADSQDFPAPRLSRGDIHAAGTAGGGTAVGGLAGTNEGRGDPNVSEVQEATASGNFDVEEDRLAPNTALGGPSGGAVGGTPARKRAR